MEPSFEWREVSSFTLTWAFFQRLRMALTFCLGYGNTIPEVCFPSIVCLSVWFNVLFFSAHLSFAFIVYSFFCHGHVILVGITHDRGPE